MVRHGGVTCHDGVVCHTSVVCHEGRCALSERRDAGTNSRWGCVEALRQMRPGAHGKRGGAPSESQRKWFSFSNCWTCFGAEPPAPVSKSPPPARSGTMESILADVPSCVRGGWGWRVVRGQGEIEGGLSRAMRR